MKMKFNDIYNPVTALPFQCDDTYIEIKPRPELRPYIKCFWGSKAPYKKLKTDIKSEHSVIPDTCMDIIFDVNFTENKISNSFCTLDDRAYSILYPNNKEELVSTFAIRFYAWGAASFSDASLKDTKNSVYDVDCFFSRLKSEIKPKLFEVTDIYERINLVQQYLLTGINVKRYNSIVNDALAEILLKKSNLKIDSFAKSVFTSSRQLERLFDEYLGVSPKKLSSLIRYQYLWSEIVFSQNINLSDLTMKYGYSDQAHLLNDFKRYHNMSISQAKNYAYKNVGFLQYR